MDPFSEQGAPGGAPVYSVSALNREIRDLLEHGFPSIWVEGEISNLARPASGHMYFSLKDAGAQVRCAMFRGRNSRLAFNVDNGLNVLVRARVSLYEARGEFQLLVEHMEQAGHGALQRAFEELKLRLAGEGLFAEAAKRAIPTLPRRIGVITSPTGAAIRDILSVLKRRFPAVPVRIYPTAVQGAEAAPQIVHMLELASQRADCEVLILARGGGSLEDLWPFNEEAVARAIRACRIPVISGIGHEVDVTIADFAADRRAATPTAAAELATPDAAELAARFAHGTANLARGLRRSLERTGTRLEHLGARLDRLHPGRRLLERSQRLDELDQRLAHAWRALLRQRRDRLGQLRAELRAQAPNQRLARLQEVRRGLRHRLFIAANAQLRAAGTRLAGTVRALEGISPLATLERGYAILSSPPGQTVITDVHKLGTGDLVGVQVARGRITARVESVEKEEKT